MMLWNTYVFQDCVYVVLCIITVMLEVLFLVTISLQLFHKIREYKIFLKLPSFELCNIDKQKQLYNFKTIITNYSLAICILSLELVILISAFIPILSMEHTKYTPELSERMEHFSPNCTFVQSIGDYYKHPAARVVLIVGVVLGCTLFVLISLLTTFLKKRYYVHPIRASLIRYTVWWCIQVIILLSCCVPYLFPFISIIGPSLLLINWIYLIRESRQLAYILRARIRDIVNYEWDPVLYKKSRSAYKLYVVFSILYIISMFMQIIVVTGYMFQVLIAVLTFNQCTVDIIYGFHLPFKLSHEVQNHISANLHYFSNYISPVITWFWFLSVIFPFLSYLIWKCSSRIIRNRNTPIRYTPVYEGYKGNPKRLLLKVHRRKHFFHF